MKNLRRLFGLPHLSIRTYLLILILLLVLAYVITGPVYRFFTTFPSSPGAFHELENLNLEELLKTIEREKP